MWLRIVLYDFERFPEIREIREVNAQLSKLECRNMVVASTCLQSSVAFG